MKRNLMSLKAILVGAALVISSNAFAKKVNIIKGDSKLEWVGSKVIGSSHDGTIDIKSGFLEIDKGTIKTGEFVIDMTTIKNRDIKKATSNAKLVGHLKSPDFFNVEKHKTATLNKLKFTKDGKQSYKVDGTLTIKGISKPISFKAVKMGPEKLISNIQFDRTTYDVRYGSDKFFDNLGDKIISDNIQVKVEIVLPKGSLAGLAH